MHFKIAQEARDFFSLIINSDGSHGSEDKNKFLIFDPYYCCALIGMAACEMDSNKNGLVDIVQGYPQAYKDRKAMIAGLLVATEAQRMGYELDNPKLEEIMLEYLTNEDETLLTDEGIKALNSYSRRGASIYQEWFPDKPRSREEFLMCLNTILKTYA